MKLLIRATILVGVILGFVWGTAWGDTNTGFPFKNMTEMISGQWTSTNPQIQPCNAGFALSNIEVSNTAGIVWDVYVSEFGTFVAAMFNGPMANLPSFLARGLVSQTGAFTTQSVVPFDLEKHTGPCNDIPQPI